MKLMTYGIRALQFPTQSVLSLVHVRMTLTRR